LGGYRRYGAEQAKQLRFIKRAQVLGFTLAEVGGLLTLDKACACAQTRTLVACKAALIERKMADLAAMRKVLARLVKQCDQIDSGAPCPIIDVLAAD
jgi:MerR family mercuric resistance operon transcriptional regulator